MNEETMKVTEGLSFTAVLSKTQTDIMKSKQQSPELVQLVLDAYLTPEQWAVFVKMFYEVPFIVNIKEE